MGFVGFDRVLLGFDGFDRVLLGLPGFFLGFSPSCSGF